MFCSSLLNDNDFRKCKCKDEWGLGVPWGRQVTASSSTFLKPETWPECRFQSSKLRSLPLRQRPPSQSSASPSIGAHGVWRRDIEVGSGALQKLVNQALWCCTAGMPQLGHSRLPFRGSESRATPAQHCMNARETATQSTPSFARSRLLCCSKATAV